MKAKDAEYISDVIRQFKLSSIVLEKELSEWKSQGSERDRLIFFIMRLSAYKANLMLLEETIGEFFDVDLSKITEGLSRQKDVMKLLGGGEQAKRAFRLYKRIGWRKKMLDWERSQMVEGEWEITQMKEVTIEDVLQKREERRQAVNQYGIHSEQEKRALRLYKRMSCRKEDLDWEKRKKENRR